MGEVHRVGRTESSDIALDLVFVHGLGGHHLETWRHTSNGADDHWMLWLAKDNPRIGVWSVGYADEPVEWLNGSSMPLLDRARNLADLLISHDIGLRPTVWVGHSLGGLVIKGLLRYSEGRADCEARLLENTVGAVFLATPHTGSDVASWLDRLARVLRSKAAKDLTANNPLLREFNTWYRDKAVAQKIDTLCYMEGYKIGGVFVVDEESADPGIPNVSPIKLDADHIVIAKPATQKDQLYLGVSRFLQQALASSGTGIGPPSMAKNDSARASEQSSDIEAVGFASQSEGEFLEQVRRQVEEAMRQPILQQAVQRLLGRHGAASNAIKLATEKLVSQQSMKAIDHWTSTVRDCLSSTTADRQRDGRLFWRASEHVHLALLPRLVSRDWISDWMQSDRSTRSPLEFRVRFREKPPNRSIEVLLCRLDAQRRISFLTTDPNSPAESAVPASAMHANDDALRYMAAPEPIAAAEALAKRLFVLDGQTPPERMTDDDWDELDSILVRGRAGAMNYYIVIPADNEVFGNPAVLGELKVRLPNLPRIIAGDQSGDQPFNCRPSDVEHGILTFYRLEPTEE